MNEIFWMNLQSLYSNFQMLPYYSREVLLTTDLSFRAQLWSIITVPLAVRGVYIALRIYKKQSKVTWLAWKFEMLSKWHDDQQQRLKDHPFEDKDRGHILESSFKNLKEKIRIKQQLEKHTGIDK